LEELENAPQKHAEPSLLGKYTWEDKEGEVALAPSLPAGGIEEDHLIADGLKPTPLAASASTHGSRQLKAPTA
jgi:hypothetical protein